MMVGTVIGVHYDGWVLSLGCIMTSGYCYWGTL